MIENGEKRADMCLCEQVADKQPVKVTCNRHQSSPVPQYVELFSQRDSLHDDVDHDNRAAGGSNDGTGISIVGPGRSGGR